MEHIFAQSGKPTELLAAFGAIKNALGKVYERKDKADDNRDKLELLLEAYKLLTGNTDKLLRSSSTFETTLQTLIRRHAQMLTAREKQLLALKDDIEHAKVTSRVTRMKNILEECEKDLEKTVEFLQKEVVPVQKERQHDSPDCAYVVDDYVPTNPPRLTLDYDSTFTFEGKLKAAVMQQHGGRVVGVVAHGMGGVGKTCALRGLADDPDIRERFSGGLLYIQLGNDANLATLISGIATLVKRTGNASLAAKLGELDDLREAVNTASAWFKHQTCLLLIDDIWLVHGVKASVLTILEKMLSENSRLVYTTRTQTLSDACGQVIEFKPLSTSGRAAREMLMNHAGFSVNDTLSESIEEAVQGLLQACQGLPVAIGIAGETVRKQSQRRMDDAANAWSHVYRRIRSNRDSLIDGQEANGYGSVELIVDSSLGVLQSSYDDIPFDRMFRALCVLEKQQLVPMSMLHNLWGLQSLKQTENVVKNLSEVSLVLRRTYHEQELVQLHDVILDIATRKASEKHEVKQFWQSLIDNYLGHGKTVSEPQVEQSSEDDVEIPRRGMNGFMRWCRQLCCCNGSVVVDNDPEHQTQVPRNRLDAERGRFEWWSTLDDGYLHDNVCRALRGAGYEEQLLWLLSQPEWIVRRLQDGGISAVERDLDIGKIVAAIRNDGDDGHKRHLEMLGKAARMGCSRVLYNKREAWFQIHGRLLSYAT